ncbi:hypothetical protein ACOI1C_22325 [Bacillus sp. DJP31]|uniref:hypothetical protein n=1 Tax=Bacillus sp. DJP31 TaxID=3409789 RepID=UPI003BB6BFB5
MDIGNLFVLLSFLTFFLLSGCVQEHIVKGKTDIVEQEDSSSSNKSEEITTDSSIEEGKKQGSDSKSFVLIVSPHFFSSFLSF